MDKQRKIIHVDMDAFFAAVEQRDFPEYRGKPLIVGGSPDKRGVVATCSYEARAFGVRSAMSSAKAYRLCPQAIVVRPRFEAYKEVSAIIRNIFFEYSDLVEPLSLDEAFLDVTDCESLDGSATRIAQDIKKKIFKQTRLTASAGVSYNKFLAKIASDINKPDGLTVILPEEGEGFVEKLPVGKFFGVGKVTEARMQAAGIFTGADIRSRSMKELEELFGNSAQYYYDICRGIDHRDVVSHRERKSLGSENTFEKDLESIDDMICELTRLADEVSYSLQKKKLSGHTLTLKVKYDNFEQVTRSKSLPVAFTEIMLPLIEELLGKTEAGSRKVRLLGLSVSNFTEEEVRGVAEQLELFYGE